MAPVPPPALEQALAHAQFLRAVARGVLGGDAEVEDVLQETFLVASREEPRNPGALRAWLAGIARRLALSKRRAGGRRVAREHRAARPEGIPSVEEVALREEARQTLVAALLALPDPSRATLLWRYYAGRSVAEIATLLDEPIDTVRTRIQRALARLRERLDATHGHDRRAWTAALIPLAAEGGLGGTGIATVAVAVAALLVAGAGTWWFLQRNSEPSSSPLEAARMSPSRIAGADPLDARPALAGGQRNNGTPPTETTTATKPAAGEPLPAGHLRIRVRIPDRKQGDGTRVLVTILRDGRALTTLFLWADEGGFYGLDRFDPSSLGVRADIRATPMEKSSVEGSVDLSGVDPGEYTLLARRNDTDQAAVVRGTVDARAGFLADLELRPHSGNAELRVAVRRAGAPAGADVSVRLHDHTLASVEAKGGEGASISVPADVDLTLVVTSYPGHGEFDPVPPRTVRLLPGARETATIDLPVGVLVDVRATTPDDPAPPFSLSVWRLTPERRPRYVEWSGLPPFEGDLRHWQGRLPPGRYAFHATVAPHAGWQIIDVIGPGPVDVHVPVTPDPRARIVSLRWLTHDGDPLKKLPVTLVRESDDDLFSTVAHNVETDEDGRASFALVPGVGYGAWLWREHLHRDIVLDENGRTSLTFRLPAPAEAATGTSLSLHLLDPSGRPFSNRARVLFERAGSDWHVIARNNVAGGFRADAILPGRVVVRVLFGWYSRPARADPQVVEVLRGEENRLDIRVRE